MRSPTAHVHAAEARVLVVDDVPENLTVLGELLLAAGYHVRVANNGAVALRLAQGEPRPDLILLDVMMPGMDGHEVLRRLRAEPLTADIPVMFLTARAEPAEVEQGLAEGAADYLTKPVQPGIVLARVRTQLQAKQQRDGMRSRNALLEAEVARRMAQNDQIQQVTIRALARLAEVRDPETGDHILRTQSYVDLLARGVADRLGPEGLSEEDVQQIIRSAPLHDIGKVGIPDQILHKPGPLTEEERAIMKTHTRLGAEALAQAVREGERPLPFLSVAQQVARSHHEHWDGTGYPDGLAEEAIPLAARLMAVADVFDSLVSPRVYKPGYRIEEACQTIVAGSGTHFDPLVVDVFVSVYDRFEAVARSHQASPSSLSSP